MIQLLTNARLTAGVVRRHLADDPVLLFLQVSRRLPAKAVRPLARLTRAVTPKGSAAVPVLLASLGMGDTADVGRRLQGATERGIKGEQARRLADIALAAHLPELAEAYLSAAADSRHSKPAQARYFWYHGAVSDAVAVLDGPGESASLQRARLAAERSILRDSSPQLTPARIEPVDRRVLHLLTNSLPHTASGYAQRSHSVLLAQQQAGWDVLAVTRLGYPVQVGKLFARASDRVDGVQYRRLLPPYLAETMDARLQQQAEELLRIALEFRPSVLHTTTDFTNGLVVRAVAEALGIPWVYEVRGQLADTWASTRGPEARHSEKYKLFQEREAEVMRDADLIVTLGQAMKANIVAAGIPANKVMIAPNAVGGDFLAEPRDAASARRELGLAEDGQYIGTVSSLVAYEGIEDLVDAFALLAGDHPDLHLLIVGEGVSRPSLQEQARRSGFMERIIFTGRVPRDRAVRYHQALDIFVVPRKDLDVTRSVTPLKPVEALACARPVVASRLPALAEIVQDNTTGLLVEPENPAALAAAISTLLRDQQIAARMGAAGRDWALRERTWAANAAALAGRYESLGSVE